MMSSLAGPPVPRAPRPLTSWPRAVALAHPDASVPPYACSEVVSYENTKNGVSVTLQDGTVHHGDVLIGADGIRSKVRAQMRNEKNGPPLKYAGYAVYTAVCDYTSIHTDTERVRSRKHAFVPLY